MSAAPRRPKFFVVGLGLSLALNVFLIGGIGAHLLRTQQEPPRQSPVDRVLTRAHDYLSPEDAATMRRVFEQNHAELARSEQETKEAHDRASAVLRAEPFDAAAFTAALDEFRARRRIFDSLMEERVVASAQAISPDGRRRLADKRGY